jgi:hypothetical protein
MVRTAFQRFGLSLKRMIAIIFFNYKSVCKHMMTVIYNDLIADIQVPEFFKRMAATIFVPKK